MTRQITKKKTDDTSRPNTNTKTVPKCTKPDYFNTLCSTPSNATSKNNNHHNDQKIVESTATTSKGENDSKTVKTSLFEKQSSSTNSDNNRDNIEPKSKHTEDRRSESTTTRTTTKDPYEHAPLNNNTNQIVEGQLDGHAESGGFIAVRRKNIVSFHIGNIDSIVTEKEIYDYMKFQKVHVTNIRMYYGKTGASARINVPAEYEPKVNNVYFWPEEITFRKWKSRSEWDTELNEKKRDRTEEGTDTITNETITDVTAMTITMTESIVTSVGTFRPVDTFITTLI